MDIGTVVLGIVVIVAIAALAKWYFKQTDDNDDCDVDEPEMNELDIGLDDRIRKMIHPTQEVDEDPYGENTNYPSYRATLVNRGIEEDQK